MTKQNHMPNILYKYRDYKNEHNRRTLFEFELFLASFSMFNDPYDGSIPFSYNPDDLTPQNIFLKMRQLAIQEHPDWGEAQIHKFCYEGQRMDNLNNDASIEKLFEQNKLEIDNAIGILSLTTDPFNYLMWSHYGNSHNSFCLGFDKIMLFETVGGGVPVKYAEEVPKFDLFGDVYEFVQKLLATKSIVWDYENEYRIVKRHAAKQIIKYPKEMIKEIYFGTKLPFKEKHTIIDFVKTEKIDCDIFELSLDKNYFKLNPLKIF